MAAEYTPDIAFGNGPVLRPYIDEERNILVVVNPEKGFPFGGRLATWQLYAKEEGTVVLIVFRKMEEGPNCNKYKIVGQSKFEARRTGTLTLKLGISEQIVVQKGDVIGFYAPKKCIIPFDYEKHEYKSHLGLAQIKDDPHTVAPKAVIKMSGQRCCKGRQYSLWALLDRV